MSTTLKYRPDLDGIRALAVLAVIIFHVDAAWLPGGFLGVDMFFVLSGYLITTIISREMQNGSFSFLEFYKRRAKRILPVFSCVLLCTSLAAAIFFLPFDLRQYVKSAVFCVAVFGQPFFCTARRLFRCRCGGKTFATHLVFIAGGAVLLCFSSFADCFFPIQQRAQHPPIHPFADCIEPVVRLFAHLRHGSLFPALCARI